jgi:ligand-binding sensor domain-containing protein
MALLISGKASAPRELYDRVHTDLAFIRQRWGDSLPIVRNLVFSPPFRAGRIEMSADDDVYIAMQQGRYTAWDSLNELYGLTGLSFGEWLNMVFLHFGTRVNPRVLTSAYQGLPGIRWVYPGWGEVGDRPRLYGYLQTSGPSYLFRDGWGDCPAGCIYSHYWYFQSVGDTVAYLGEFLPSWDSVVPVPGWWTEARKCIGLYHAEAFWERQDSAAPTPVTDLLAGNPASNSVTLSWTTPYDGGSSGRATGYDLRYAKFVIADSTWAMARGAYDLPRPGPPGSPDHFTLQGLESNTTYYFAIKTTDYARNWSALSNVANAATIPSPGWVIYDTSNSDLAANQVSAIAVDRDGSLWFATDSGACRYDGVGWTTYTPVNSGLPYERVTAITVDSSGNKWFATGAGVARFDGFSWTTYRRASSGLAGDVVLSIAADALGGVWFGIVGPKTSYYDGASWTSYDIPSQMTRGNPVWTVAVDIDGSVWFGTGVDVSKFDGTDWAIYTKANSGLRAGAVRCVAIDRGGAKWMAYGNSNYGMNGVTRFDGITWTQFTPDNSGLASGTVNSITVGPSGELWFATGNGATRWDGTAWSTFHTGNSGLVSNDVLSIAVDKQGGIWFGTRDRGVSRISEPSAISVATATIRGY